MSVSVVSKRPLSFSVWIIWLKSILCSVADDKVKAMAAEKKKLVEEVSFE